MIKFDTHLHIIDGLIAIAPARGYDLNRCSDPMPCASDDRQ